MPSQRFLRLLLVEDIDDIQAILQFSLGILSGWQVFTAKSTQDWLTLAQYELPDVILLDSPHNAREMLAQLKVDPLTRKIPVVCLVSRDRLSDQLQTQQDGAAAIVGKPFNPISLMQTILQVTEPDPGDEGCP
jgi:CheY-like chemotaxis protein